MESSVFFDTPAPSDPATAEETLGAQLAMLSMAQPAPADDGHLSGLFTCAAQEFRQPLRKMTEIAETLRTVPLPEEFRELPETLHENARGVLECVNSFLDLVRLENGEVAALKVAFDLELAASDIFETLAPATETRSIELVFSAAPDLPRRALGDPDRIRQILRDLVESAIRRTETGYVSLVLENAASSPGAFVVRGTLSDSSPASGMVRKPGMLTPGMAEQRAGDAPTQIQVTLAKSLILHLGGCVEAVAPVPGEAGKTLRFEIPLERDPEIWSDPPLPYAIVGMTAMTVGLTPLVRAALTRQLAALGFTIVDIGSCQAARSVLKNRAAPPGVIFVDAGHDSSWEDFGRWVQKEVRPRDGKAPPPCVAIAPAGVTPGHGQLDGAGYTTAMIRAFSLRKVQNVLLQLFGSARPNERAAVRDQTFAGLVSPRVLVVLSDASDTDRIDQMLRSSGCRPDIHIASEIGRTATADGEQKFGSGTYDLAIVELAGPGTEIVRAIRDQWTAGRLPLVGIAPQISEDDRARALAAGVNHILPGLRHERDLRALLAQWIDRAGIHPAYDHAEVLARCGGDEELLAELAVELRRQMDMLSTSIRNAIGRHDQRGAVALLRQLREEAVFFSAAKLAGSAAKMEQFISNGDWSSPQNAMGVIRVHMLRLFEQLPARRVA